ncbi:hypothetical protein DFAR_2570006 [Desulfarculales bacterium]
MKSFAEWSPPEPGTGYSSPAAAAGSPPDRQGSAETSKPNRFRIFIKIGRHETMPPKPDASTPEAPLRPGPGETPPQLHDLLNAGCNEKYDATRCLGVIPVSRGQECSTTRGHFFIPKPTSKVQDNGIKIPIWSSQSEKVPYLTIRTKQKATIPKS